jgi:hypothetical protein
MTPDDSIHTIIASKDVTAFSSVVNDKSAVRSEMFMTALKSRAYWIFLHMLSLIRKELSFARTQVQSPKDVSGTGKRSVTKSVTVTANMDELCIVPQSVFFAAIAAHVEGDKEMLRFVIACGIPIDITTYRKVLECSNGLCSALFSSMNKQCAPNERIANAIASKFA